MPTYVGISKQFELALTIILLSFVFVVVVSIYYYMIQSIYNNAFLFVNVF